MNKRLHALVLTCLMAGGITLEAARPSFFERTKKSIAKFFNDVPTNVKWGTAFIVSSILFYLACSKSDKSLFTRRYDDLVDNNEYADTVLEANGREFDPVQVRTARGNVTVEQFNVAKQNLSNMRLCTCGQHAVTQAEIIAAALRNGELEEARAHLRDRRFVGAAVQQTCNAAKILFEDNREIARGAIEPRRGWTEATILHLLLQQQEPATFFVGNEIPEHLSPRDPRPHPAIAQLNAAGIHRVILNVGAHWITVIIDRPVANAPAHYYLADSAGTNRCENNRSGERVRALINRLEGAAPRRPSAAGDINSANVSSS